MRNPFASPLWQNHAFVRVWSAASISIFGSLITRIALPLVERDALLEGDLWLRSARHANAMAARLAEAVADIDGLEVSHPVQANAVFARLPRPAIDRLLAELPGEHPFYIWDDKRDPLLPNVPCLADLGLSELTVFLNHRGVVVPPHLPKDVSEKIEDGFRKVISDGGEGKAFLEKAKYETNQMWGQEFRDVITKLRESLNRAEPTIRQLATQ